MGFFDKIKSAASSVTGGGAKVFVEVGPATRGAGVPVTVRAEVKADLKISGVYLLVRGQERAQVMDTDRRPGGGTKRELVRGKETSYETRVELDGSQQLEAGEERVWEGEFSIPPSAMPTIDGKMIQHVWQVQAGLDAVGNDPDSGWVDFTVA